MVGMAPLPFEKERKIYGPGLSFSQDMAEEVGPER
ncbi:hypothetical protein HKBW3S03_01208, partial [Candidatus Hakubella thermalkaliphila]